MVGSMSPTELSPTGHAASDRVGPVHNSVAPLLQGPFWARLAPTGSILAAAIAVTIRDPHSPGSWASAPPTQSSGCTAPGAGPYGDCTTWPPGTGSSQLVTMPWSCPASCSLRTPQWVDQGGGGATCGWQRSSPSPSHATFPTADLPRR